MSGEREQSLHQLGEKIIKLSLASLDKALPPLRSYAHSSTLRFSDTDLEILEHEIEQNSQGKLTPTDGWLGTIWDDGQELGHYGDAYRFKYAEGGMAVRVFMTSFINYGYLIECVWVDKDSKRDTFYNTPPEERLAFINRFAQRGRFMPFSNVNRGFTAFITDLRFNKNIYHKIEGVYPFTLNIKNLSTDQEDERFAAWERPSQYAIETT